MAQFIEPIGLMKNLWSKYFDPQHILGISFTIPYRHEASRRIDALLCRCQGVEPLLTLLLIGGFWHRSPHLPARSCLGVLLQKSQRCATATNSKATMHRTPLLLALLDQAQASGLLQTAEV